MNQNSTFTVKFHNHTFVSLCNDQGCRIFHINKNLHFPKNDKRDLVMSIYSEATNDIKFVEPIYIDGKLFVAIIKEKRRMKDKKLKVTDILLVIKEKKQILFNQFQFEYPVLSCASIDNKLAVCTEHGIYIFSLRNYKNIVKFFKDMRNPYVKLTPPNPNGIYAFGKINFAYPKCLEPGVIEICRLKDKISFSRIKVHERSLSAIEFNATNDYIATASDSGKIIIVYSCYTKNGQPIHIFQSRGSNVNISSLNFSQDFAYLGCSGKTKYLYIFKLPHQHGTEKPKDSNLFECIRNTIIGNTEREKNYYISKLPNGELKSSLIIKSTNPLKLLVVTIDGLLKLYTTNTTCGEKWGEFTLVKETQLYL